jgi:phenylpropionate dioxygenase-like ring-hydroxylating dioxygenase large terminal subunit
MNEYYILSVKDRDNYHYKTLLFDNQEDYDKAVKVINKYEKEFYEQDDEVIEEANWYEGLIKLLDEENLLGLHIEEYGILYVR